MHRLLPRARAIAISSALATASLGVAGTLPASAASTTWHVQVGGGDQMAQATDRFYVNDITVHRGDTVEFSWAGFHTVTFNPPANLSVFDFFAPSQSSTLGSPGDFVNGAPGFGGGPGSPPPAPFDLKIGPNLPTGNYWYRCSLHQFMKGVVRVTNGELPRTDAQNIALGMKQSLADAGRAASLDKKLTRQTAHKDDEALVGAGDRVVEITKFFPSAITVRAHDEVTFTDPDLHDPHTVTFGPVTGNPADNSFGVFPSGPGKANAYDGVSALNSGYLFHESQYNFWNLKVSALSAAVPRTHFSVTFTTPGTYPYYCLLHGFRDPATGQVFGMSGTITVLASQPGENN